ncbi:ras-specific guanine nucleotide-releasing factor 2-like [Amphibalanus amphitrite]|uniref:ras-specific guanine nucleotide-releasing factor 2-like n=1 Tax=Amphibalanus amphitrite TaxID=1232801 RepID=UPI001C91B4C2|nr:ras-specific guanine nucleotide-releasing factor 2-like [Amphibalanus amphitrite]
MLSPKMQRGVRINDNQLLMLAEKARYDQYMCGSLYKRTCDNSKWQLRWFNLYQNMLFYYETESSSRPSGVILLEGCYCERLITTAAKPKDTEPLYCLSITYRRENQRQYDLRANSESECKSWIEAIRHASFNRLLLQKEELEQKHLHLLQIVESEKTAKWQYSQQCDELTTEIKKLRNELCSLKKDWRFLPRQQSEESEESDEIKKIKKVQSFFRGWLCRRRWKQIVEEYIKSPHAESMRKRNSLVFRMVEAEEEYVEQLNILVTGFLRPFKMAASSKLPPCSHEDVNSIFLNSETLLFLHQIFLKGLSARMESWPTLVLGDLFDMLLPMLSIYQEYVRNHHYSLQVLTECKTELAVLYVLSRLETSRRARDVTWRRSHISHASARVTPLHPVRQIPRYIITLHELLAHTPHNHVERRSLDEARKQLEQLSRQMHDEVSETENIRKNLAIERMIVEGCDILLDVNQVFVRQGSLVHILPEKQQRKTPKIRRGPLDGFSKRSDRDKELIRQCFLFSNHLILATRTNSGHLHLINGIGRVSLADAILIEDPSENDDDLDSETSSSTSSLSDNSTVGQLRREHIGLDFKLIVERKGDTPLVLHLVAPTAQEKAAWVSDIAQCLDNVQFNNWFRSSVSDTSSVTMPHSIRNDPKLFRDDIDIRFSKTLNSCKVPQVRYATPERLWRG